MRSTKIQKGVVQSRLIKILLIQGFYKGNHDWIQLLSFSIYFHLHNAQCPSYIYIYIYERETSVCMCYTITVKQKLYYTLRIAI